MTFQQCEYNVFSKKLVLGVEPFRNSYLRLFLLILYCQKQGKFVTKQNRKIQKFVIKNLDMEFPYLFKKINTLN